MLKTANPMLQPSMPAPPGVPGAPKPPAAFDATKQQPPTIKPPASQSSMPSFAPKDLQDGLSWLNPAQAIPKFVGAQTMSPPGFRDYAGATENVPPLQGVTHHLPDSLKGPVDSALGFVQKGMKQMGPQSPGMFASLMGGVAPGLTKGLLSTPVGLPVMAGLHGLLRGGESFAAAKTLFNPLLSRIGLG